MSMTDGRWGRHGGARRRAGREHPHAGEPVRLVDSACGTASAALNAAAQIGDDTIQRKTQGRVQPETWTHGSAAQRSGAFRKGLDRGLAACDLR